MATASTTIPLAAPTELAVDGMTCNNCARHVTEAIQSVPAVASAAVKLEAGRATIRWQGESDIPAVVKAVSAAGFDAHAIENNADAKTSRWSALTSWQFNVMAGVAVTLPLMIGEWFFHLDMAPWWRWTSFGLSAFVQSFCGARFYAGAWRQLKVGQSNMDTLVALGSTTAFGYSTWALLGDLPGHLYFMESAAIITLISLGHWFEARTSQRAESSLQALLQLAPPLARRRNADGSDTQIPVGELRIDDVVVLKPGDQIPVDGRIQEGRATVDESMLTGESLPIEKSPGDPLFAGTANTNGHVLLRVTATGEATALAHIIAAVARAQSSRAEIQRLGDRVSSVFVPIVVVVAIATGLWWGFDNQHAHQVATWLSHYLWPVTLPLTPLAAALIQAAAVLIIACPCAMGLATPAAIMAGTNAAARLGILVRDGIALERAGKITAIVFDKTGTLTQGKPVAAELENYSAKATELAAALARNSNHPLSQAVAKLSAAEFTLTDWQELRGDGVQARWQNETIRLGSLRWLRENKIDLTPATAFEQKWSSQGATILGIAANEKLLGVLALKDVLKPDAASVVQQLRSDGLKIYLLTGDNRATANAIANQIGLPLENVAAETRPEDKARFIEKLRQGGERVAFVGDGINDAPALESADLGIAVSRASDVAREAADIILLKSEIQAVPEALELARKTLRTIKQNLFWAFFYNLVGIPLAAMGFMSPVLCAAAMGLSDVVVIGNALRLLRWKSRAAKAN